jgi:hypothetical protein
LKGHSEDPNAALALGALKRVEAGESLEKIAKSTQSEFAFLTADGEEGKILQQVLDLILQV